MATRSNIGVENPDGTYTFIYHHWDGYPSYLGRMLIDHYNSHSAACAIVELGALSILRERLAPNEDEPHTFDSPLKDVTIAYGRDRGEEGVEAQTVDSMSEVHQQQYAYVWRLNPAGWWFVDEDMPLAEFLESSEDES